MATAHSISNADDHQTQSDWLPLMDYAMKNGVSLSTLRRHIKANKIPHRVVNGRYLLPAGQAAPQEWASSTEPLTETASLRAQLKKAQEEITELKMLVAIYEEQESRLDPPPSMNG